VPRIVRENEETKKIFSYNEDDTRGLIYVEDVMIRSFNFPLPSDPMTTYSKAEVKKVFGVGSTCESRDLLLVTAKIVGRIDRFTVTK